MRKAVFILFLVHLFCAESISQQVKIGLWRDGKVNERFYFHSEEQTVWFADDGKMITIEAGRTSYFTLDGNSIKLSTSNRSYGRFKNIKLIESSEVFVLKGIRPPRKEEKYDQGIEIIIDSLGLKLINYISDFDAYVAGVIESESGKEQVPEFYKVQAVISRTYALSNKRRHEAEGFNLCDQVHCQVYHGIARFNPDALEAARNTEGQVLVDSDLELITAAFHSNCGGHTINSEDVWSKALPYLVGVEDPYCHDGAHAKWQMTIPKNDWKEHLMEQSPGDLTKHGTALYSYQPVSRQKSYPSEDGYELKKLRYDWKLNSTFFSIEEVGEILTLNGKGFGHGVGLCQEGAMGMVSEGFTYKEVLQHYYTDVHLIHLSVIDFFKEN